MEKLVAPTDHMRVIIVGSGHLGAWLATLLDTQGYRVTVIAPRSEGFERLGAGFTGATIVGSGGQTETLEQAGIAEAQVLVALTNHDTENLLISQMAKSLYQVPQVFCGLQDPILKEVYQGLGLTIITRTEIEVQYFLDAIHRT